MALERFIDGHNFLSDGGLHRGYVDPLTISFLLGLLPANPHVHCPVIRFENTGNVKTEQPGFGPQIRGSSPRH